MKEAKAKFQPHASFTKRLPTRLKSSAGVTKNIPTRLKPAVNSVINTATQGNDSNSALPVARANTKSNLAHNILIPRWPSATLERFVCCMCREKDERTVTSTSKGYRCEACKHEECEGCLQYKRITNDIMGVTKT